MKLYRFDGVDEALELLPLTARRALDLAGRKLSLAGFRSLPLSARGRLAELGEGELVNCQEVSQIAHQADPPAAIIQPVLEPAPNVVPSQVAAAFGSDRPLPVASWSALSALDRYALCKVAEGDNLERRAGAYAEIVGQSAFSSHVAPEGGVRMVSVGRKQPSLRRAEAETRVSMNEAAFECVAHAHAPKGDVLGTARLAGIMGAKRTADLIPLCHPLSLTRVDVQLSLETLERCVKVTVVVECFDRTGVEMEALTGASVAALTVYDMLKAVDRSMEIGPTRLVRKSGGRTGDFER